MKKTFSILATLFLCASFTSIVGCKDSSDSGCQCVESNCVESNCVDECLCGEECNCPNCTS